MSDLRVHKVVIRGVEFRGLRKASGEGSEGVANFLRSKKVRVAYFTDQGRARGRLDDWEGVKLHPALCPDAFEQTFVDGRVLKEAERILKEHPEIVQRLRNYREKLPDWDSLTFSLTPTDAMYYATAKLGGKWRRTKLVPFQKFLNSPAAVALNYGQGIFEGLKARLSEKGRIVLFRPTDNAQRMIEGAKRIVLNPVPEDYFLEAVIKTVKANERFIPPRGKGSLYIRPVLSGTGEKLGVQPAGRNTFYIYVSPVGPYFKGTIKLLVEEEFRRACPGGTGNIKAIGNYAPSLLPGIRAKNHSEKYAEVIYLDVIAGENVEEVGAANAFFVKDRKIYTPALTGTILPGITRESIIRMARDFGFEVIDNRRVPIGFVMICDEAFCTGTAAVISPIGSITWKGKVSVFNERKVGPISEQLYEALTAIQEEKVPDPYGWVHPIAA